MSVSDNFDGDTVDIGGGDGDNMYTWEGNIYHKRLYIDHYFIEDSKGFVNHVKRSIAHIRHCLGLSQSQVMLDLLLAGIEKRRQDIRDGKDGTLPEQGTPEWVEYKTLDERLRIMREGRELADLEPIYKSRGPDGFMQWCQEVGIPQDVVDRFLQRYSWFGTEIKQSDADRDWLRNLLEGNGEMSTTEVRQLAESDGIIVNDTDWERLSKTARRLKLNGTKHGHWQWR